MSSHGEDGADATDDSRPANEERPRNLLFTSSPLSGIAIDVRRHTGSVSANIGRVKTR
jgi:hypothetical protein